MIDMITGKTDYITQVGKITEEEAKMIMNLRKENERKQHERDKKNFEIIRTQIEDLIYTAKKLNATVNFTFEMFDGTTYPYLTQLKDVYICTGKIHKTIKIENEEA